MNKAETAWQRFRLGVRDANPLATTQEFWRGAAQTATVGMFLIFFITALYFARTILLPVTLALVIGTMLAPLTKTAARYGIPAPLTAALLVLGFFAAISVGIMLSADPVREWIGKAPEIGTALKEKLHVLDVPLAAQPAAFRTTNTLQAFTKIPEFPDDLETVQVSRTEFFDFAKNARNEGIGYLGGCCGANASYIRSMRAGLDATARRHSNSYETGR